MEPQIDLETVEGSEGGEDGIQEEAVELERAAQLEDLRMQERTGVGAGLMQGQEEEREESVQGQQQQFYTQEQVAEMIRAATASVRPQETRLRSPPPRFPLPGLTSVQAPVIQAPSGPQAAVSTIMVSPWQGEIDLSTKQGKALWDEGIRPTETKFTGQGKDLFRFLADVTNRVNKCYWHNILIINNKNLLTQYGEMTLEQVKQARDARQAVIPRTLSEAKPKIHALMLYHFLYESLGTAPQKKVSTKIGAILQDGPTLLKTVLDDTFVGTKASTFLIMNQIYSLQPKSFKWSIKVLNIAIREKLASLESTGNRPSDDTHVILALLRAYKECSNQTWLFHVAIWEDQWTEGRWNKAEDLMEKGDKKYDELICSKQWGKKSPNDDQIVALTAQKEKGDKSRKQQDDRKSNAPKWKFDKSQSQTKTLWKNEKEYKWCTGPGHNGIAMWVRHEPGKCTKERKQTGGGKTSGFTAATIKESLKDKGLTESEIESKVEAIMGVIDS